MKVFKGKGTSLSYTETDAGKTPVYIWAHGWGQSRRAFTQLSQAFQDQGHHIFIDFPGFGDSPEPPKAWSTEDYAHFMAEFIKAENLGPVIWTGHSFGCRVGVRIAALYPDLIDRMVLIAGAGLPRLKSWRQKIHYKGRVWVFKSLKHLIRSEEGREKLRQKFGSSDYANVSGVMRETLIKTVNEDLSNLAPKVPSPVLLIYGENDTETPPDIGERYQKLMPNAEMICLPGQDHYSVLGDGRHQVTIHIKRFFEGA